MAALSLAGSREQFSMWLLQNVGIEGNDFTVNEARATARNGDAWKDCCAAWQGKCALPPDDDSFRKLRATLLALKKEPRAAAPQPRAPPSRPPAARKGTYLPTRAPVGATE